jgi:glycosyltransferase involved in cell wall biosynthesis
MKILWATPHCLLSNIDGAAILALNLLKGLRAKGHEVIALTITSANGGHSSNPVIRTYEAEGVQVVAFEIGSAFEEGMTNKEINSWLSLYISTFEVFSPELVMGYGGLALDMHVYSYAKFKKIKTAALLLNTSFQGTYWCKDVDLIFTDSKFTSDFYKNKFGTESKPLGPYIDKSRYSKKIETQKKFEVLFVNSIYSKGAGIVAQLIFKLNKLRPDIKFHLIDGRGDAKKCLAEVGRLLKEDVDLLNNYRVSKSYDNVAEVLTTVRCLVAPSLADESLGLVVVEAKMNLVPAIVTRNGGLIEALGDCGAIVDINKEYFTEPFRKLLTAEELDKFVMVLKKFFDDHEYYEELMKNCLNEKSHFDEQAYFDRFDGMLTT